MSRSLLFGCQPWNQGGVTMYKNDKSFEIIRTMKDEDNAQICVVTDKAVAADCFLANAERLSPPYDGFFSVKQNPNDDSVLSNIQCFSKGGPRQEIINRLVALMSCSITTKTISKTKFSNDLDAQPVTLKSGKVITRKRKRLHAPE